jgi:hypothetical protein
MRSRLTFILVTLIMLLSPGMQGYWSTSASGVQQDCIHPMQVGPWEASFLNQLKVTDPATGVNVWLEEHGSINFNLGCDGTITADKFVNNPTLNKVRQHVLTVLDVSATFMGEASCGLESDWKVENARLEMTETGQPRMIWTVKVVVITSQCIGDDGVRDIASSIWGDPTGGQSEPRTFTWTDEGPPPPITRFMGGDKPWQGPLGNISMEGLKQRFTMEKEVTSWSATFKGDPAPTSTPEKGVPVVTGVTQELEQIFLEKITPVLNTYTASIDWQGEDPGQVLFRVGAGATTIVGDLNGTTASAPIQIDSLPAGDNILTVTAISLGNKTSAPFERIIQVVPVPEWAVPSLFTATTKEGFVLYESTAQRPVPAQPAEAKVTIPDFVPYLGGVWGLMPTQFQVNMAASSAGGLSNAPVVGAGGVGVGGRVFPLTVRSDSFFRTNMTDGGLLLDDSSVKMELPESFFTRSLGLLEVIPGASVLRDIPFIGSAVDVSVFTAQLRTSLSGEGKLGADGADLNFVDGSATSKVGMAVAGGPNFSNFVFLQLIGSVDGTMTFGLTPDIHLTNCTLSGSIFAFYGAFGFIGTFPSPPSAFQFVSCDQFNQAGVSKVLAAQPYRPEPLSLPERSASWKPEIVSPVPVEVTTGDRAVGAAIVEDTSALISSPRLASGPDGRMALVWIGEDAQKVRPQAFQARLRLFDGETWGPAISLSDDTRPDYSPSVAFDAKGQAVVAWVQNSKVDLSADAGLTDELLQSMEIVYAVVAQDGTVISSGALTADTILDFGPQLASGGAGEVWLAWQSNSLASSAGQNGVSSALKATTWNGERWSEPQKAYTQVAGPAQWHLAAYDGEKAMIVATVHEGEQTSVINLEHGAGGWASPRTLAGDLYGASKPRAAYTSSGLPVAAWSDTNGVSGIMGNLNATPLVWLPDSLSVEGIVPAEGDSIRLITLGQADGGPASLLMTSRAVDTNTWGSATTLAIGWQSTSEPSVTWGEGGEVAVVYAEPLSRKEQVTLSSGEELEVDGVPELADVQLVRVAPSDQRSITSEPTSTPATTPTTSSPTQLQNDSLPWLIAGGAAGVVLLLGAVTLLRRRRPSN